MPPAAIAAVLVALVALAIVALALKRARISIPDHQALIIQRTGRPSTVAFHAAFILPIVARAEIIDMSTRRVSIELSGRDGVQCRDNIRADVKATFHLRINHTAEDVLKVAQTVGAEASGRQEVVEALFRDKLTEAIKVAFKQLAFDEIMAERERLRDDTLMIIGSNLNGFSLEDMAFAAIDQTPIEALDPNNALDAEGIRRITERAAAAQIETNRLKHDLALHVAQQDLEAQRAILDLERRQAEAQALAAREIAEFRAHHEAELLIVEAQQRARAERVTLQARAEAGLPPLDALPLAPSAPAAAASTATSTPPSLSGNEPARPAQIDPRGSNPLQHLLDTTRANTQSLLKKIEE